MKVDANSNKNKERPNTIQTTSGHRLLASTMPSQFLDSVTSI